MRFSFFDKWAIEPQFMAKLNREHRRFLQQWILACPIFGQTHKVALTKIVGGYTSIHIYFGVFQLVVQSAMQPIHSREWERMKWIQVEFSRHMGICNCIVHGHVVLEDTNSKVMSKGPISILMSFWMPIMPILIPSLPCYSLFFQASRESPVLSDELCGK